MIDVKAIIHSYHFHVFFTFITDGGEVGQKTRPLTVFFFSFLVYEVAVDVVGSYNLMSLMVVFHAMF